MSEPVQIPGGPLIPAADLSYEFSRAGGPGGQHVNTTDTRVRLRFALDRCAALSNGVKARVRAAHPGRITEEGELILVCDSSRSRGANVEEVRARLAALIAECLHPPKVRRATRPTKGSQERRVDEKKRRGTTKSGRRWKDEG